MTSTGRNLLVAAAGAMLLAGVAWLLVAHREPTVAPAPAASATSRPESGNDASAAESSAETRASDLATRSSERSPTTTRRAAPLASGASSFALAGRILAPAGSDPSRGEIWVFRSSGEPKKKFSLGELMRGISAEPLARAPLAGTPSAGASRPRPGGLEEAFRTRLADAEERVDAKAKIAPDGAFAVQDLGFARMEILLHHPHLYLDEPLCIAAGADGVARAGEIEPRLGGAIAGVVSLPDGSPAAAAKLSGVTELDPMEFMSAGGSGGLDGMIASQIPRATKCDGEGRFELWGLPPRKRFLLVAQNDRQAPAHAEATTAAGATVQADLTLLVPATLTCTVSEGATPIAKAEVNVALRSDVRQRAPALDRTPPGSTDSAGVAVFKALAPGKYQIVVSSRGFKQSETDVELRPGEDRRVAIEAARGSSIAGIVVDIDGKPIEGASVGASPMPALKVPVMGDVSDMMGDDVLALMVGRAPTSEKTAADGTFRLRGLGDDPVDLIATTVGFAPTRVKEVKPMTENLRIVLGPAGAVAGRIVAEETGRPVPSFKAEVTVRMFMVIERPVRSVTGQEAEDGKFLIEEIPPGSYTLKIQGEGFAAHSSQVEVTGGATLDAGVIRLPAPAGVRGIVVDGGGAPVAGARVRKRRGGVADFAMLDAFLETEHAVSDGNGEFAIHGLAPGHVTLEAIREGFAPSSSERFKVEKGKVAGPVRLVLQAGGSIAGVLEGKSEHRNVKWIVTATCQRPMHSVFKEPGADGRFRLDHLPPGVYDVAGSCFPENLGGGATPNFNAAEFKQQMRDAMESAKEQIHRRVTVRNGETVEVVLGSEDGKRGSGVVWTGLVSSAQKPVPDAMLMVTEFGAEPVPRIAMADEHGRFRIAGLEPGRYRVEVRTSFFGGGHQHGAEVTIPATEASFQHDLEVPTGSIQGRVVARGSKKPIRGTSVVLRNTAESRRDSQTESMMPSFAISDRDGGFQFTGLGDGVYELEASDLLGFGNEAKPSTARLTGLAVRGGEELANLLLEVAAGASVEAQVLDPFGAPLAGAEVSLLDGAGKPLALRFPSASDSGGRAILASLGPGKYQVVATSATHAPAFSGPFELQENGAKELILTLARGTDLEVEVRGDGGKILPGCRVLVEDERGRWIPTPVAVALRATQAEPGVFAVGSLASGRYRFLVEHRSVGSRTIEANVPEGAKARIVLKL